MADLRAQKMRAFLTTFGIIWGTVAIIVLIAFGIGMQKQTMATMHGMGENISILFPGQTTKAWQGFGIGRGLRFTEDDVRFIQSQVQEVSAISAEYVNNRTAVRMGDKQMNPGVTGAYPIYGEMRNIIPEQGGRFLNDMDIQHRRRVAVLGDKVHELLFGKENAIGKTIMIGMTPFTVIGVMQKKIQPSSYNRRDQDRIFIPTSTYSAVYGTIYLSNIIYKSSNPLLTTEIEDKVRETLSRHYKFDPTDKDAAFIWSTAVFEKFLFNLFLALNIFLGIIGSFTLGVAGLGVANIMFIVVQERIKEIGVKRAVGARRSNIMSQFFFETFFIVFIGSAIGFLISYGLITVIGLLPIQDYVGTPKLSWQVVAITCGILAIVGFAAGLMPARRAANLNVVECLRV